MRRSTDAPRAMTGEGMTSGTTMTFTTPSSPEGMRWAILLSILGPVAWLCFTLVYVGFWAQGFTLFQSIVVILTSLIALAGVMGAAWTWYGFGRSGRPARS